MILGASFVAGLVRAPGWTALIGPVISFVLAGVSVAAESPDYDMPGFGWIAGPVGSLASLALWGLGRAIANRAE